MIDYGFIEMYYFTPLFLDVPKSFLCFYRLKSVTCTYVPFILKWLFVTINA